MAATLINTQVPDFKVQAYHNNDFKTVTQKDLAGKWSIFFFYPADFTFVCPTELGDMADKYETFQKMGVKFIQFLQIHISHTKRGMMFLRQSRKSSTQC